MHLANHFSAVWSIWKNPEHLSSLGKCTKRLQLGLNVAELHERQTAQHAASHATWQHF